MNKITIRYCLSSEIWRAAYSKYSIPIDNVVCLVQIKCSVTPLVFHISRIDMILTDLRLQRG